MIVFSLQFTLCSWFDPWSGNIFVFFTLINRGFYSSIDSSGSSHLVFNLFSNPEVFSHHMNSMLAEIKKKVLCVWIGQERCASEPAKGQIIWHIVIHVCILISFPYIISVEPFKILQNWINQYINEYMAHIYQWQCISLLTKMSKCMSKIAGIEMNTVFSLLLQR